MSILVKNSQLNNEAVAALNMLMELDINASVAFRLSRIIREISSIVDDKVKMEKKIFDKWVDRDEDGNPIPAKDAEGNLVDGAVNITNIDEFTREMSMLMDVVNEIPYDRVNFEDL